MLERANIAFWIFLIAQMKTWVETLNTSIRKFAKKAT